MRMSESVRTRDGSDRWWGATRSLYAARFPTNVASRLAPRATATEGFAGRGGEACSPRAQPASQQPWRIVGSSRAGAFPQIGGLLEPAQVLCRLTPASRGGGPRCVREARGRGRLAHRGHTCTLLRTRRTRARTDTSGEVRRGEHTPRRATSTRTTRAIRRAVERRERDRARRRRR